MERVTEDFNFWLKWEKISSEWVLGCAALILGLMPRSFDSYVLVFLNPFGEANTNRPSVLGVIILPLRGV